jgi:hypothetical protein
LSTLGTTWSLLIGSASIPEKMRLQGSEAAPILLCCILGLFFEMCQFLAAYYNNRQALAIIERDKITDFKYNPKALSYRFRIACFYLKIIFTIAGAIILISRLVYRLTELCGGMMWGAEWTSDADNGGGDDEGTDWPGPRISRAGRGAKRKVKRAFRTTKRAAKRVAKAPSGKSHRAKRKRSRRTTSRRAVKRKASRR